MKNPQRILKVLSSTFPDARVFLVGGAVRDALLKRKAKDRDYVVTGVPLDKLVDRLTTRGKVDVVGKQFGVIKFRAHGQKQEIDIALPRTEQKTPSSVGRYRDVHVHADPSIPMEKDLARRDFTINALAQDVSSGNLIDPFGGKKDLRRKVIRAVGDPQERFLEDKTRILRAVRLACELDFTIEKETFAAMKKQATDIPQVVAREMIGKEVARALCANAGRAVELLGELDALPPLPKGGAGGVAMKEDGADMNLLLASLLLDSDTKTIKNTLHTLGLDTLAADQPHHVDVRTVQWLVKQGQRGDGLLDVSPSEFERVFMNPRGKMLVKLLTALRPPLNKGGLRGGLRKRVTDRIRLYKKTGKPLITGDDVVAAGITGARVRVVLDHVRDAQLRGEIRTRKQALKMLRRV